MKKEISVARYLEYLKCAALYKNKIDRVAPDFVTLGEVGGDAGHKLAAGLDEERVGRFIDHKLGDKPEEVRQTTLDRAKEFARRALELIREELDEFEREVQFRWTDDVTGWTIFAKPDVIGKKTTNGRPVLVIGDIKSGFRVSRYHESQLFMFALMVTKALNWTGWVELMVFLPDAQRVAKYRFSHIRAIDDLEEVRNNLWAIERSSENGVFLANPRFSCSGCRFFEKCTAAQAYFAALHPKPANDAPANALPVLPVNQMVPPAVAPVYA